MIQRQDILKRIQSIQKLPSFIIELQSMLEDEDVDFKKLAEKIKYDPSITSKLLSIVNSAYFGLSRSIKNVDHAISFLGTKKIYEIILTESLSPLLKTPVLGYDLSPEQLWKHSVAVSIVAEDIAKINRLPRNDYIFTAGLLHNVGKIVLGTFIESETWPVIEIAFSKDIRIDEAEKDILGMDHAEAGALLLENWGLPETLSLTARYHHSPELYNGDNFVLELVHAADYIVMTSDFNDRIDNNKYHLNSVIQNKFKIDNDLIERLLEGLDSKLQELKILFS